MSGCNGGTTGGLFVFKSGNFAPYQGEPLATANADEEAEDEEESDADGILPSVCTWLFGDGLHRISKNLKRIKMKESKGELIIAFDTVDPQQSKCYRDSKVLTVLRSRSVCEADFGVSSRQSFEGIASFRMNRFVWKSPPPRLRSSRCSKQDGSKYAEQRVDDFEGCQPTWCLCTKRIHFSR